MRAFGERLAQGLKLGDWIAIDGPLGAGKTTLCKGILHGLGFDGEVASPSYAIVHQYEPPETSIAVAHADLYRLNNVGELKELGISAIELLPIAQTPGRWNWGYDGVNYFAPRNTFGKPDELKEFIDACHNRQIAVILDVVYNHVGPEGNYLNEFGPYRSPKHGTPWVMR